jgi:hypothetical protein
MKKELLARCSKGQLKIQEMAFVLIAIMIFFVLGGIFFINVKLATLKENVVEQRDDKAVEMALKLADTPEFAWSSSKDKCNKCVDLDKVFALKKRLNSSEAYTELWGFDTESIQVEVSYPEKTGECTISNYPECRTITLFRENKEYANQGGYVALCRRDLTAGGNVKCEMGRILVSSKSV